MKHRDELPQGAPQSSEAPLVPKAPPAGATFLGEQMPLMEKYVDLLCDTGVSHGLLGPREIPRIWDRHILNCAVVHGGIDQDSSIADIGAGAGLPGLVLAIARPDLHVTLIEPLLRRIVWLESVVEELVLPNVEILRGRAEEFWGEREFDVVTARAVARLGELARWSLPLVRKEGQMFVLKGSRAAQEVDEDAAVLERLGVRDVHIQEWGGSIVDPPTVTIRLVTRGKAPQLTRKQAGVTSPKARSS